MFWLISDKSSLSVLLTSFLFCYVLASPFLDEHKEKETEMYSYKMYSSYIIKILIVTEKSHILKTSFNLIYFLTKEVNKVVSKYSHTSA